jgi:hypothetical protein
VSRRRDRGAEVVLTEISPEGAFAGRVFAVTLLVSAVALIGVSWDDIWRVCNAASGPCVERSAGAVILSMFSLAAIAWSIGILVRTRRRPVDPQASSRYVVALGALLSLGCIFVAGRIPAFTCDHGRFDDVLVLCMHPPSTSEPASWLLLKKAVVVLGLLGGILVSARPRNVRVTAPLAVAVWGIGFGWLILDTLI